MSIRDDSGVLFKEALRAGHPKFGIFVNSASPVVAEQLSHSGYDWLLVDTQHGPMNPQNLSSMLTSISTGKAKSMVRVGGYDDRSGIQQALDLGADGILVPYINTAEEARAAVSCCLYPTAGTRSVYFPQRSTNVKGLLGYVGNANKNVIVALQVETESCINNIKAISEVQGVDMLFLGQNDLCMSMGLYEKYQFPDMYTSPELGRATELLVKHAMQNNLILGIFLFGTDRVKEFLDKGFTFISIGNDLHHILTQCGSHMSKLEEVSSWTRQKNTLNPSVAKPSPSPRVTSSAMSPLQKHLKRIRDESNGADDLDDDDDDDTPAPLYLANVRPALKKKISGSRQKPGVSSRLTALQHHLPKGSSK